MCPVKSWFLIAAAIVLQSHFCELTFAADDDPSRPNIVFLFADDQSSYSVGCYGNKDVKTPNMDQLAKDGVAFDKHYNTTAICMASRSNVFTGMYEYKTGCNFQHGNMHADVWAKSYPVLLREAGYLTAFAGKFGLKVEGKGLCESDFDYWGGGPGQTFYATAKNESMKKYAEQYPHSTLSYGAFGQDVIRDAAKQDKPFCLSISFKAPHKPATPDPRFNDIYAGKKFTKPENFGRQFGEHLSPQSKQGRQYPRFSDWKYDTDYDGEMAKYHQQVYAVDVAVGMIRDELKKQGLADNTVVIYTSDNGYICGSHGYGSKVLPMEESTRVPLMIYDPRSPLNGKQLRCDRLTGNIDVTPTLLEIAGLPIPSNVDGKSLMGLLQDPTKGGHEQLAMMNLFGPLATHSLTCVTRTHKYTYWWYGDDQMEPTEELFDLKNDPLELHTLAGSSEGAPALQEMRQRYDNECAKWKQQAVDYNNYQRYGELFDRNVPISDKKFKNSTDVAAIEVSRPNIVFVLTDDQGMGDLSCMGNKVVRTPYIDQLYQQSTRLTDYHVSPTCAPTRSALMSGRPPFKVGVTHTIRQRERLALNVHTLPQALKSAGYTTGLFGKWHLGDDKPYLPQSRGFDEVLMHGAGGIGQVGLGDFPPNEENVYFDNVLLHNDTIVKTKGYCTDVFFQAALSWMKQQKDSRTPYFSYISLNAPHGPLVAPKKYTKRFLDLGYDKGTAGRYGMIENIDDNVGLLMQTLEQWNALDNTLVIFMTDNGATHLRGKLKGKKLKHFNFGMSGGKNSPNEGGTHVPAFFRWKGVLAEGADVDALTAHIDIYPTLAELAGAKLPEKMQPLDGRSLLPLLKSPKADWPDRQLFVHCGRWNEGESQKHKYKKCAVRTERWRLVNHAQLFDIDADPGESTDVAAANPEVVKRLQAAFDKWWDSATPLMVNEGLPKLTQKQQPLVIRYAEQEQKAQGVSSWKPAEHFELLEAK